MDRRQRILQHIQPGMKGIEIGPYVAPLLPKADGWDVLVLDVQDAARLRAHATRDAAISAEGIARIEKVDLLGPAHRMAELAGAAGHAPGSFDFVVSSHNLEHLPDPLRFLQAAGHVLKPGGVLAMAVPDKRCCFDMLRPRSTLSAILDAYFERREQPSFRQQFETVADFVTLAPDALAASSRDDPLRGSHVHEILQELFNDWVERVKAGSMPYRDAHCWTFTPASAELILRDLRYLDLIDLDVLSCSVTSGNEFYVHMRHAPDVPPAARAEHYAQRRQLLQRIAAEEDAYGWREAEAGAGAGAGALLRAKDAEIESLRQACALLQEQLDALTPARR